MSNVLQRMAWTPVVFDGQIVGWQKKGSGAPAPDQTVFADDLEVHAAQTQAAYEAGYKEPTMPTLTNLSNTQIQLLKSAVGSSYEPSALLQAGGPAGGGGTAYPQDVSIPTPKTGTDWLLVAGAGLVLAGGAWYYFKGRKRRR